MSKIRSLIPNKQAAVAVSVAVGLVILAAINVVVLVPTLIHVYRPMTGQTNEDPIDTKAVESAIQLLE